MFDVWMLTACLFMGMCAQVRLRADKQATGTPCCVLLVHENVHNTPEACSPVLQWHARDTHILFMCRGPGDLQKINFAVNVPQLAMPVGLHKGHEFPEVVDGLLQSSPHVVLDDTDRDRLYKVTAGVPLAVHLTVKRLRHEAAGEVSKVLMNLEKTGGVGTEIYAECIAKLTAPAQSVLRCLAQFEADDLPEVLLKAVVAEVLGKRDGTAKTDGLLLAVYI